MCERIYKLFSKGSRQAVQETAVFGDVALRFQVAGRGIGPTNP